MWVSGIVLPVTIDITHTLAIRPRTAIRTHMAIPTRTDLRTHTAIRIPTAIPTRTTVTATTARAARTPTIRTPIPRILRTFGTTTATTIPRTAEQHSAHT